MRQFESFPSDIEKQEKATDLQIEVGKETATTLLHD